MVGAGADGGAAAADAELELCCSAPDLTLTLAPRRLRRAAAKSIVGFRLKGSTGVSEREWDFKVTASDKSESKVGYK